MATISYHIRTPEMTQRAIIQAYRNLYKAALYACRYSTPSRYILRHQLRTAFRKGSVADFNPERIKNTLEFLDGAGREAGMESRILKNLTEVEYWRRDKELRGSKFQGKRLDDEEFEMIWGPYNHTIAMLNESMEMCLPIRQKP